MSGSKKYSHDLGEKMRQAEGLILQLTEIIESLQVQDLPAVELRQYQKQLQEISKSTSRLEQMEIPIPGELRKLKEVLLSKIQAAEEVGMVSAFLIEELGKLQTKVRSIRQTGERPRSVSTNRSWSGLWFVNVGESDYRNWDDNRCYGFIGAGGGERYTRPLQYLTPGDKIFAYMSGLGYVGYGEVIETAVTLTEFVDKVRDVYPGIALKAPKAFENSESEALCEWAVPVRWIKVVDRDDAKSFKGAFANQNIVCKLRHEKTIEFLRAEFEVDLKEVPHKSSSPLKAL